MIFLRNLFYIFLGDMNSKQIPCLGGCLGLSASNSSRPFLGISTYSFNALTLRQLYTKFWHVRTNSNAEKKSCSPGTHTDEGSSPTAPVLPEKKCKTSSN